MPPTAETIPLWGNRRNWESLPPDELEAYARRLLAHYRQAGYPYHEPDDAEKRAALQRLVAYRRRAVVRDGEEGPVIAGGRHAMGLCWSYFPHAAAIGRLGRPTPLGVFNDDEAFLDVLRCRLRYGSYMSDGAVRKALRVYRNVAAVSNFRPAAAMAVYQRFRRPEPIAVWDMSAGFGGRMLGAWASGVVGSYTGTEPASLTYAGLLAMHADLARLGVLPPMRVEIVRQGSEDFRPPAASLDLCFTSPPYFFTERYSDEPTQSGVRFPRYRDWLNGFLRRTLLNCRHGLKSRGPLVLNIANVKTAPEMTLDAVLTAQEAGFLLVEKINLALSKTTGGYKYEPLLVFVRK